MIDLPECPPGEEVWPVEGGYVCGPADEAIPAGDVIVLPVEPAPPISLPVEPFPEPLPLDPLPSVPDVLAMTGPMDDVAAWIILALGMMLAGWMIWANDRFEGKS